VRCAQSTVLTSKCQNRMRGVAIPRPGALYMMSASRKRIARPSLLRRWSGCRPANPRRRISASKILGPPMPAAVVRDLTRKENRDVNSRYFLEGSVASADCETDHVESGFAARSYSLAFQRSDTFANCLTTRRCNTTFISCYPPPPSVELLAHIRTSHFAARYLRISAVREACLRYTIHSTEEPLPCPA
jgi:hypothetical protein